MTQSPLSDLAAACRLGDERAYEELYRTYADGVHHMVLRMLGNPEDAADVVQETFLTAFRRIATYRGEGSLRAWLYQIAFRRALRHRRGRRPTHSLDEEGSPPVAVAGEPVPERDFHAAVEREIRGLPERARLVFTLHTVEGLSHGEIAQALSINEGTSKSQLSYARSLLRQRLARWCRDLQ